MKNSKDSTCQVPNFLQLKPTVKVRNWVARLAKKSGAGRHPPLKHKKPKHKEKLDAED